MCAGVRMLDGEIGSWGGTFSMFPSVEEMSESAVLSPCLQLFPIWMPPVLDLGETLFSEAELWHKDKTWIQFPFKDNAVDGSNLTVKEEDQLIELSTDSPHRNSYDVAEKFWISCQTDFLQLAVKAMWYFLPFATTYLCESGFSSLAYLKSKYRSRLQPESDMAVRLTSSISPRIGRLCATHQDQSSH